MTCQYWIWSVEPINWEMVKKHNIWATYSENAINKVKKGDIIIFYLVGHGIFCGIFEITSEWLKSSKLIWPDEIRENTKKYPFECSLKPIKIGEAILAELIPHLSFITNKGMPGSYLRGTHGGPANFGRPIPYEDYKIILESFSEMDKEAITPVTDEFTTEHDEVISKLLEIGSFLGFEVSDSLEDTRIAKGAVVDTVWKLRIGNFGEIMYVFEVQIKGNVDSLILNLLKASRNPVVRGLVIVTTVEQLQRILNEVEELADDFKRRLRFITIDELNKAYVNLKEIREFRTKLGLQI